MPQYCAVPHCKNKRGGHQFPNVIKSRKEWIVKIKRAVTPTGKLWEPGEHDVVCSDHFSTDDYISCNSGRENKIKKLKPGAIPTLFPGHTESSTERGKRALKRKLTVLTEEEVQDNNIIELECQQTFKPFSSTRIILDATEIPIEKPSHVLSQRVTFSNYKNRNTLKTMIGISPNGLVTFVSPSYGGSCSDRQIIENSELYVKSSEFFGAGESIMADRGILVQDLFASANVKVNIPTMLRGKHQLGPDDVVRDRRIASQRIHVERVIGLAKTYKIITVPLPYQLIPLGSKLVFICFMLCNFRTSIVS
ncbi:uncharacterized protein LOC144747146 [Ciona intestinalis]